MRIGTGEEIYDAITSVAVTIACFCSSVQKQPRSGLSVNVISKIVVGVVKVGKTLGGVKTGADNESPL